MTNLRNEEPVSRVKKAQVFLHLEMADTMSTDSFDEALFPAELHARMADDYEITAAQLAAEIDGTNCPHRRARLESKHAQRTRNASYHRKLAQRPTLHLWTD
jgi:hypothetical protein